MYKTALLVEFLCFLILPLLILRSLVNVYVYVDSSILTVVTLFLENSQQVLLSFASTLYTLNQS